MPSINPGPASTATASTVATLTPVNTLTNPGPQGLNSLRLLASARGISLAAIGDVAVMPVINASSYVAATVITTNSTGGTVAGVSLGVFTAAAAGGTAIRANGALTGQTTSTFAFVQAASSAATLSTAQSLFVNVGTAVAGTTTDIFVYGYDVS